MDFRPIAFVNKKLVKWVIFGSFQKNGCWCRVYEVKMKVVGNWLYFSEKKNYACPTTIYINKNIDLLIFQVFFDENHRKIEVFHIKNSQKLELSNF